MRSTPRPASTRPARVPVDSRFALADGAQAHARLESRASTGKVLLVP